MNGNNVIMRTIYFKNGTTQQVNQKIVEVLNKKFSNF
jgi:hypothetical protein